MNLDYIDQDVAYLLGLIIARGEFHVENDVRRLAVSFPYRSDAVAALPGSLLKTQSRETAIRLGIDDVRKRVEELLETQLSVEKTKHLLTMKAVFTKQTIGWRDLRFLTANRVNCAEFEVPEVLFQASREIAVEFIKGFADASSDPSPADADSRDRQRPHHRVVLQVQFGNWRLPVQICQLLQTKLDVPVSHILWGHPNLRAPGGGGGWAKETRIRIFAEDFEKIGYYFRFKQDVFKELVDANKVVGFIAGKPCNPKVKKVRNRKERHPDESDARLPAQLAGCHFNGYWQICRKLGCAQGKKSRQIEIFEEPDDE